MSKLKLTSETLSVEIEEILMVDTIAYNNKVQNGKKFIVNIITIKDVIFVLSMLK